MDVRAPGPGPWLAAAVQLASGPDRDANLAVAERLVREAAGRGARLVALPEVFSWRGELARELAAAEPIPGPTTDRLAALARELGLYLVGGSILERAGDGERVFNSCPVFGPRGEMLAVYRKIHLFDVELTGQVCVRESDTRQPGAEPVVVRTELGTLGLSICYDLRFPELYRRLVAAGAEVLLVPAAFTFATGAAHWEILLRARAIENQAYVIAADQFGPSPSGVSSYGNSMIVDPWGTPVARASEGEAVVVGAIDPAYLGRVRRQLPALAHRRLGS